MCFRNAILTTVWDNELTQTQLSAVQSQMSSSENIMKTLKHPWENNKRLETGIDSTDSLQLTFKNAI